MPDFFQNLVHNELPARYAEELTRGYVERAGVGKIGEMTLLEYVPCDAHIHGVVHGDDLRGARALPNEGVVLHAHAS